MSATLAVLAGAAQAQVTYQQVTNGLVDYYPLDIVVTNGTTITTPDYIGGRDMILNNMNSGNLVAATRPTLNAASTNACLNFSQVGGPTLIYYASKGQNAVDGSGDFLPFCNQLNASMSFWVKVTASGGYNDTRFFGECDNSSGQSGPIWLWGSSSGGNGISTDQHMHFLFRENSGGAVPFETLVDGTYQAPFEGYYWVQGNSFTAANPLDGSWHMLTMTIDTNRVIDIYVDGVRDAGPGSTGATAYTDANGNPNWGPDVPLTNTYYTTNMYSATISSNPPPNGYVRWMWNATFKTGNTAFGGFKRNAAFNGGIPTLMDDIAFWKRKLNSNEIMFVYTNGLPGIQINRPLEIKSFAADFPEVGAGDTVRLSWSVTGANTNSGGLVISGVGDVSQLGLTASTNFKVTANQTFTLTAHNGVAPDVSASASIKTFDGVDSNWHLIQRFDGVFADTSSSPTGISGNGWTSDVSDYRGQFEQWNVVTLNSGNGSNKVLTPRNGYTADVNSITGFDSRGATAYGALNGLTLSPGQMRTLFFRFSLQEAPAGNLNGTPVFSDMDFNVGVTDSGLIGPFQSLVYPANVGPQLKVYRSSGGNFDGSGLFNVYAGDFSGTSAGTTNSFSYTTAVDPAGLQTNVNYYVWMDISNDNTHLVVNSDGTSNTVNMAVYSVWMQKQGGVRTNLFSGYHADRDYATFNVQDIPTPFLDKVFVDIGDEDITTGTAGAYIGTNMIAVDDFYLSKAGFNSSIPRLFDITAVAKNPSGVTIKWDSLGSMYGTNTYTIQRKSALTDATWTTLAKVPSDGDSTTYTDATVQSGSAAYYRINWP
ncbi:MAG TPA: hypothetical protein VHB20_02740 [Verrucomicrobiae bacterium]|nr:hypothetical protein [Verrucomicrobiae bacterium]